MLEKRILRRLSGSMNRVFNRLCGPVVRVPDCYTKGPGIDSRRYQIFCVAVGLERGPLSPREDK
jgi:hypothetical protein